MQGGRADEALATLRRAIELQPADAEAHNNVGIVLLQTGRPQDAIPSLRRAIELKPEYSEAHYNLANAYTNAGQTSAAVVEFREALRGRPDWPEALGSLAWLEATDSSVLNPQDAVRLASRAVDLTGQRDPQVMDVLGAAYASAGQFAEARRTAEAAEAAAASSEPDLVAEIRSHLNLYRQGQALVLSTPGAGSAVPAASPVVSATPRR
jgi:Tfp pilus assembly protein PilF